MAKRLVGLLQICANEVAICNVQLHKALIGDFCKYTYI